MYVILKAVEEASLELLGYDITLADMDASRNRICSCREEVSQTFL